MFLTSGQIRFNQAINYALFGVECGDLSSEEIEHAQTWLRAFEEEINNDEVSVESDPLP